MAITINGTGTITGLTAGGLPDGSVVAADLASSLDLTGKTVTLPSGTGGKILQVVQTSNADVESSTSTSYVDIPDLTATITPSSTNSKILILSDLSLSQSHLTYIRLFRGTNEIGSGTTPSSEESLLYLAYSGGSSAGPFYYGFANPSKIILDSPATTSPTTYKYQWRTNAGTLYLNRPYYNTGAYNVKAASTITLLEVAG